jgi:hypothetical protein
MKFNPSSEDEIAARAIWSQGIYAFEILDAEEKLSASKGNPMLELKIEITRRDGSTRIVRDYLLPQRPEKLLHAATTCGLLEKYESGEMESDDFVGKRGKLKLGIKRSKDWPTKNVVLDYV